MEWEMLQAGAVGKAVLRPQAVIQLVSMASDPGGDGSGTMPWPHYTPKFHLPHEETYSASFQKKPIQKKTILFPFSS